MIRRGLSQKVAMTISGHKTADIFERSNIIEEADIAAAAEKIQAGAKAEQAAFGHQTGMMEGSSEPSRLALFPTKTLTN